MTDAEIKKAFEYCTFAEDCADCPLFKNCPSSLGMSQMALDLINRQQAEIESLNKENYELVYKLECLLCHATGGKLSKSTYGLTTMTTAVNDCVQDSCTEAQSEAIKEFKSKVENDIVVLLGKSNCTEFIDCLEYRYKEMVCDKERSETK